MSTSRTRNEQDRQERFNKQLAESLAEWEQEEQEQRNKQLEKQRELERKLQNEQELQQQQQQEKEMKQVELTQEKQKQLIEDADNISFNTHVGLDHFCESYAAINNDTVQNIINKNNESLQETNALIDELTQTFDEKEKVPAEMAEFLVSIKDNLKGIAEAQAQQQTTIQLFDELLAHKPYDYDSNSESKKLWDSVIENTQNTMNDIKMVETLKDNYIEDFVDITETMNNVETENDTIELTKKIKKMSETQEKYKAKICEVTKNALESLKIFMGENVTKDELDRINNDITKYQKLDFESEKNIQSFFIAKNVRVKSIDQTIDKKQIELKQYIDAKHDIKDELDQILKLKLGRQHAKKLGIKDANLRSVQCPNIHSAYGTRVCEWCYMQRWYSWKIQNRSKTLEIEETQLSQQWHMLESQQKEVESKINYYMEERIKVGRTFDEKINEETSKLIQYAVQFKSAMGELDNIIAKTGVDESKLNDFVQLTRHIIPSIMEEQNSLNKLSMKCTCSYSLFIGGITPKRDKYKIEKYLQDRNLYDSYLQIYIMSLAQFDFKFMHEIQCETQKEFENNILPILKKRFVYYPSNNSGVYGVFNMENCDIPSKVLRTFANICCNNADWNKYYESNDGSITRKTTKKFTSKLGSIMSKYIKKKKVKQIHQINVILSSFNLKNGMIKCLDHDYNELQFNIDEKDNDLIQQILNTQNIGSQMKQDVYITVNEIIYSNKTKQQTVIKAFIKSPDALEKKMKQQNKEIIEQKERETALIEKQMKMEEEITALKKKLASDENTNDISIQGWLNNVVGLPQYISNFVDAGFDMEILKDTTKDDLREIGIKQLGHVKKILKAIENMK